MALPSIEDCRCSCHSPVFGIHVDHVAACCTGQTLAWGGWGIGEPAEMVTKPATFSEEEED